MNQLVFLYYPTGCKASIMDTPAHTAANGMEPEVACVDTKNLKWMKEDSDLLEISDTFSYGELMYPNFYRYRERRDKRSKDTNISCQTCGRQYNHHSSLHTHIKLYCGTQDTVKKINVKKITQKLRKCANICPYCKEEFAQLLDLKKHQYICLNKFWFKIE
ncbi:hypothetical protein Bhyg_07154 [Pseudolycoriella hygida]|uniref:C2H2-type domain-containing protein n=1 Tax=Pseudolycoriella hygida TaxID=35572 RepID=A0A9Q0S1Q6_9DIPT|nr:hypothetical protein Bhyg_07154 [Pseudolycoriella hygida]